jgi:hypothetical protein
LITGTINNNNLLPDLVPGPHWSGLTWASLLKAIGNTCIMDSFLSHVIYQHRRNPDYFNTVLRLVNNRGENAIRNVIMASRNLRQSRERRDDRVHEAWVHAFPEVFDHVTTRHGKKYIDCKGSEWNSIVRQLIDSSQIWIAHNCECEESSYQPQHVQHAFSQWSPDTLNMFRRYDNMPGQDERPSTQPELIRCNKCNKNFNAVRGYVAPSTWVHRFNLGQDRTDIEQFRLNDYPREIEFEELTTGDIVQFEIAYFTVGNRIDFNNPRWMHQTEHQTSVHYIEGQGWRYYDGMNPSQDGALQDFPVNFWNTHNINSVTYIRKL